MNRTESIWVRLTSTELRDVQGMANARRISVSDLVRCLLSDELARDRRFGAPGCGAQTHGIEGPIVVCDDPSEFGP